LPVPKKFPANRSFSAVLGGHRVRTVGAPPLARRRRGTGQKAPPRLLRPTDDEEKREKRREREKRGQPPFDIVKSIYFGHL
jgi:hypothetical protein